MKRRLDTGLVLVRPRIRPENGFIHDVETGNDIGRYDIFRYGIVYSAPFVDKLVLARVISSRSAERTKRLSDKPMTHRTDSLEA